MPAPIDYGVQIADPTQAFLGAFQTGASIQEAGLKQEQQQQQMANQKLIQEGFTKLRQPGATAADYANLAMMLPETQAKSVRESFSMLSGDRQQNALQQSGQVFSAFKAGKPEIAIGLLDQQITAKRNIGDEEGAKFLETWRDVAKENPKATEDYFGFTISQMPGGDKIIESATKLGGERRAEALAPSALRKQEAEATEAEVKANYADPLAKANLNLTSAQIKKINSDINNNAARLQLDKQIMQATVAEKMSSIQKNINDIPAETRKLVNESAVAAATSQQLASQYKNLAQKLEAAGGGYGAFTSAKDFFDKTLGTQSSLTELRQEYTRLRNAAAIKSLPPGVATDKDIELALRGIPPENADARTMAGFLRGMAKMQDIEAAVANAKTDWLANNNGALTRAKSSFIAGDYATKPGETYNDFTQRVVQDVGKRYTPSATPSPAAQIPTKDTPPATPVQSNIRSQADAIIKGGR